jgi:hypothetical protein
VQFIAGFKPDPALRAEILQRLAADGAPESSETTKRRAAINAELDTLAPEPTPDIDLARSVLEDFTTFWTTETEHEAKRQFLTLIFEGVWLDERRVVAVQPKPSFLPFFENHAGEGPGTMGRKVRERRDSNPRPPA